jgi:hypothetical protein
MAKKPPTPLPAEVESRAGAADVIVTGRVTAVRPVAPKPTASRRGTRAIAGLPITEHDPQWREATVSVTAVHKGRRVARSIRVRFPASTDVAWATTPKLRVGQRGVLLLRRTGGVYSPIAVVTP